MHRRAEETATGVYFHAPETTIFQELCQEVRRFWQKVDFLVGLGGVHLGKKSKRSDSGFSVEIPISPSDEEERSARTDAPEPLREEVSEPGEPARNLDETRFFVLEQGSEGQVENISPHPLAKDLRAAEGGGLSSFAGNTRDLNETQVIFTIPPPGDDVFGGLPIDPNLSDEAFRVLFFARLDEYLLESEARKWLNANRLEGSEANVK